MSSVCSVGMCPRPCRDGRTVCERHFRRPWIAPRIGGYQAGVVMQAIKPRRRWWQLGRRDV